MNENTCSYKIVGFLCAMALFCALTGYALRGNDLPLRPALWLPMLLTGSASVLACCRSRRSALLPWGWVAVLFFWCLAIDYHWTSLSWARTGWWLSCLLFVWCISLHSVCKRIIVYALCLCTAGCALAKIALALQILPQTFKLFDNEAGYAAALTLGLPACLYLLSCRRMAGGAVTLLTTGALAVTHSRTAWLACAIILACWCKSTFFPHIIVKGRQLAFTILFGFGVVAALWTIRPEAAEGRLYIDQITLNVIATHPLTGSGCCGFHRNYMNVQAEHFAQHGTDTAFGLLADNIPHAFNEMLSWCVSYGMVGLLLLSVVLYQGLRPALKAFKQEWNGGTHPRRDCFFGMLTGACVLGMTSYPFVYPYAMLAILSSLAFLPLHTQMISPKIKATGLLVSLFTIGTAIITTTGEHYWLRAEAANNVGNTAQATSYYKKAVACLPAQVEVRYNYAADLNAWGHYAESDTILQHLSPYLNDYDTEFLAADNAYSQHFTKTYEAHLIKAEMMVPNRFAPLWCRFDLAREKNDAKKATTLAQEILNKTIKVPSDEIEQMRADAQAWIKLQTTPRKPPKEGIDVP